MCWQPVTHLLLSSVSLSPPADYKQQIINTSSIEVSLKWIILAARIVLEQINSAKKIFNRTWTIDPRTVCTDHFLSFMSYPCARSQCLKDWDFNYPYVVMLYGFLDLEEVRGFSWNQWLHKDHGSSPFRGSFFAEFICSYTILSDLPEWSILGKPRMSGRQNVQLPFLVERSLSVPVLIEANIVVGTERDW